MKENDDKSSKASLNSLPLDLFTRVIAEIIATLGLRKAIRIRLVSREFPPYYLVAYTDFLAGLFYNAVTTELCFDYTCNPHGVVDELLEKHSQPDGNSKRLGDKLAGRLLYAQMQQSPNHVILSHIKKAIEKLPDNSSQSPEEILKIRHDVCEVVAHQVGWTRERDSSGIRQITFRTTPRLLREPEDLLYINEITMETFRCQQTQIELSVGDRRELARRRENPHRITQRNS